jgi:uncharacterized membrane protein YkoI
MFVAAALFAVALSTPALPVVRTDSLPNACLSADEMHDAVNASDAVQPTVAHRRAREAEAGDILRMRLCREDGVLHYHVTILKRDGRVARVTIEASSGKVSAVR